VDFLSGRPAAGRRRPAHSGSGKCRRRCPARHHGDAAGRDARGNHSAAGSDSSSDADSADACGNDTAADAHPADCSGGNCACGSADSDRTGGHCSGRYDTGTNHTGTGCNRSESGNSGCDAGSHRPISYVTRGDGCCRTCSDGPNCNRAGRNDDSRGSDGNRHFARNVDT